MTKKVKSYSETELMKLFGLTRLWGNEELALMKKWTSTTVSLNPLEEEQFDVIYQNAKDHIIGWMEEDVKMQLISPILFLSHIKNTKQYYTFYERTIEDTVEGHFLKTKTDFMIASGAVGIYEHPFFHFQEYKPFKNPSGDSMGQLLEAFLIAQKQNNNGKPLYGCEIMGGAWRFVIFQDKTYCVSDTYETVKRADLLQIIAILRHFKHILETELLD